MIICAVVGDGGGGRRKRGSPLHKRLRGTNARRRVCSGNGFALRSSVEGYLFGIPYIFDVVVVRGRCRLTVVEAERCEVISNTGA